MAKRSTSSGGRVGLRKLVNTRALPLIGAINCACCALVIGGGFLSAFIYYRDCVQANAPFNAGTGALVGFIAAPFYALANTVMSGIKQMLMPVDAEEAAQALYDMMDQMGQEIPPAAEQVFETISNMGPLTLAFIGFCISLLIAAIFSTIGGVIGGAAFGRDAVPPPAPSSPADDTTKTM